MSVRACGWMVHIGVYTVGYIGVARYQPYGHIGVNVGHKLERRV